MTNAFICGCEGTSFSASELAFFREAQPWGLILFKRNVCSPNQIKALTSEFRSVVGRADAPVFIDQEGGRVQRMGPPTWRKYPPAAAFARHYRNDFEAAKRAAWLVTRLMAEDLLDVGIDADCLPVLDLPQRGSHQIIGDRAYSADPAEAATLARAATDGLMAGGVLPVIKHIPGHGRAKSDSHEELPVVDVAREDLQAWDFRPFSDLSAMPMAMTAHVVYSAVDAERPATLSERVISQIIRNEIGFDGLLMTDDLSMKALDGSMTSRVADALSAGCDMMLHCNGNLAEMHDVAAAAGRLEGKALARADAALASRKNPADFDREDAISTVRHITGESR